MVVTLVCSMVQMMKTITTETMKGKLLVPRMAYERGERNGKYSSDS